MEGMVWLKSLVCGDDQPRGWLTQGARWDGNGMEYFGATLCGHTLDVPGSLAYLSY